MADQGHDYGTIGAGIAGFFTTLAAWWAARKTAPKPAVERRENDLHTRRELEAISQKLNAMQTASDNHFDKIEQRIHEEVSTLHRRINDVAERTATLAGKVG